MEDHILKVHSTTLKHGKCKACLMGKLRAAKYYLGGADKERLKTLNADTIVMKVKSSNGNTDAYHGVMTRSRYGVLCPNPDKSSASTAKSYLVAKHEIESITDPGGVEGYKIQRNHTDHGTEFEGAHKVAVMNDRVIITKTLVGSHQENCFIEQENGSVETMAIAAAAVGIPDETVVGQLWDELYVHSRRARNHISVTDDQKKGGYTVAEEQMQLSGISDLWFDGMQGLSFGMGIYVFVRKHNRATKLAWHAIECIFVGQDVNVPGAMRAMPYKVVDGKYILGKTLITKKFVPMQGESRYPLMRSVQHMDEFQSTKTDDKKWAKVFDSLGFEDAEWSTG